MKEKLFDSVKFDLEAKTFTVNNGTAGTYSYKDVVKCQIKCEDAKYKGTTKPFTHCVLSGPGQSYGFLERSLYVGLKVTMKNEDVIAIYISNEKTVYNSTQYVEDMETAEDIKRVFEVAISKYKE